MHCGQTTATKTERFCCSGCEVVYHLINDEGFDRFYELRDQKLAPLLNYFVRATDLSWLDELKNTTPGTLTLAIEGVQCAACTWLIQELARRHGHAHASIDIIAGIIDLRFDPQRFALRDYLEALQRFGYRCGPYRPDMHTHRQQHRALLIRLGICAALAMNSMFFSISLYLGLASEAGRLLNFVHRANFALASLAVVIGGSYFIARAFHAWKQRVLHFDIPIAIGIATAYLGSCYAYVFNYTAGYYFDTVTIFIALMLAGRYAQERVLQRNSQRLLDETDLRALRVLCIGSDARDISFSDVRAGDRLLIRPGGIVPVAARLVGQQAISCSLSWISGESHPVDFLPNAILPAGSALVGAHAVEVIAEENFAHSALLQLIPQSKPGEDLPMLWQWVTRWYVLLVLSAAGFGAIAWSMIDPRQSILVAVSVLVVTCPCGIGLAVPLARGLANRALIHRGLFARSGDLLDRWLQLRHVIFDKTGTLTLSGLQWANPDVMTQLTKEEQAIVFNTVARSQHPASQAIYQQLLPHKLPWLDLHTEEIPGSGISVRFADQEYFLGKTEALAVPDNDYTVTLTHHGIVRASFTLRETILDDATRVIHTLQQRGITVHMLSGDNSARVEGCAHSLGINPQYVRANCSPAAKAAYIKLLDQDNTVMIGDGLNDALASEAAWLAGSPVWERSLLAKAGNFFFISRSLQWLTDLWSVAERLHITLRHNVRFAVGYNSIVVTLALAGLISPLVCAIIMPLSSIGIVSYTAWRMRES